jgi:predicted RNA-binding Zn-ribbon protein involved in translation (DUF1610 family)
MGKVTKISAKKKTKKKKEDLSKVSFMPPAVTGAAKKFTCKLHGEVKTSLQFEISPNEVKHYCPLCVTDFFDKNKINKVEVESQLIPFDEYTSHMKNQSPAPPPKFPRLNGLECPNCGKELMDTDGNLLMSMPMRTKIHCSTEDCDYKSSRRV